MSLDMRGQFTNFSGVGAGSSYPDPFYDIASLSMPQNMRSALYWCEHIYSIFGTYRMAMERVNSYFLTDIEILNASDDETEKWTSFLGNTMDAMTVTQNLLRDRQCYGNGFASVIVPFKRFLGCPKCGYTAPLREIHENNVFSFDWQMPNFVATCPTCKVGSGYRGKWRIDDKPDDEEKKIKVKRWNPHEIEILHDPYTDDVSYLWRIPEDYKMLVKKGHLFHLERASEQVISAIHQNVMFRFNPDVVFHMKEPVLAGIVNRGWGIPRILSNFRQIWYVQVLRRFNEAIALDYVVPFRIITPAAPAGKTGGGLPTDALLNYNGSDFRNQVNSMIRRRRRDPGSLQTLPFPVNFQMFGADANQLAPRDLLDQGMETLLNDAGTPIELYNGSLQLQTAPVALRLFESTWHHLVHDSNAFLQWLVRQVGQILSWEAVEARLKRVTIADNLEKQMMAAQLMMSQQLSGTTVLRDFGYDWRQEQKQIAEEATYQGELQARTQEEMSQSGMAQQMAKGMQDPNAQAAGGAPAGGAPAGGAPAGGDPSQMGMMPGMGTGGPVDQYLSSMSGNVPQTPNDMLAVADSLAQELLGLPESVKDSQLRRLKQSNPVLHSLVKARMEEARETAKLQASQSAQMQQAQGGM